MSTCAYCGEKENFVPVQGIIFCGQCGRKVQPHQPKPAPVSKVPQNQNSPMNSSVRSPPPPYNTLEDSSFNNESGNLSDRLSKIKKNRKIRSESESVVSEEYPAPAYSPTESPKESPHQMLRSGSLKITMDRPTSQEMKDNMSTSIGRRVSGIANEICGVSGNEHVYTLTKTKLGKIEQAIRQQVKFETRKQAETDHSILEMEIKSIQRQAEMFEKENSELKQTLEQVMDSFQEHVDGTRAKINEQTAQIGILEMEYSQLLESYDAKNNAYETMFKEHEEMKLNYEKEIEENAKNIETLHNHNQDFEGWQEKYENLRTQASTKMRQAAAAYQGLQSSHQEQNTLEGQLNNELTVLQNRISVARTRLEEAKEHKDNLTKELERKNESLKENTSKYDDLLTKLNTVSSKYDILKEEASRTNTLNVQYREEVALKRDEIHKLSLELEQGSNTGLRMKSLSANVSKLHDDNRRLKSQLFDQREEESKLKTEIDGDGTSFEPISVDISSEIEQYKKDNELMKNDLDQKTQEYTELMTFCEGLMSECEALKKQEKGQ